MQHFTKPRLTRDPTIPEAARYLECSEAEVERLIKPEYKLEVVGRREVEARGPNPRVLRRTDVEDERDRRERMVLLPHEKIVATVGCPDDIDAAIEIAGLRPVPAAHVLDAIAANGPGNDIQVVVITQEALDRETDELMRVVEDQIELVVLTDEFEYKWLIRECRELIEARMERKMNKKLKAHW